MNEAYKSNIVVGDHGQIVEEGEFSEEQLSHPTVDGANLLRKSNF